MGKGVGFLVVLRVPSHLGRNRKYRGIYRRPLWSMERYAAGWDDPYLSGDYVDDDGLIPTDDLARAVLDRLLDVEQREDLEVISVIRDDSDVPDLAPPSGVFLGFDVASRDAPFWSVVSDVPVEPEIRAMTRNLNDYGLFNSHDDALTYFRLCIGTPDFEPGGMSIWRVDAVELQVPYPQRTGSQ